MKKGFIWNPATCSCENGGNAGSITDDLVITFDGITDAAVSASTKVSCSVPIKAANIASPNFDGKKLGYKMGCYNLYIVLIVVILLFHNCFYLLSLHRVWNKIVLAH